MQRKARLVTLGRGGFSFNTAGRSNKGRPDFSFFGAESASYLTNLLAIARWLPAVSFLGVV